MVIINPMKCENCNKELQADAIMVTTDKENNLIRICGFCGYEVNVSSQSRRKVKLK